MLLDINKIKIGIRVRVELGDTFEELKNSINKRGQFHPLILREDFKLVAGFRRYTAMKELEFKEVEVKIREDMTEEDELLVELEENIQEPLTWKEKAILRKQIHQLREKMVGKATHGHTTEGQTLQKTADELHINIATLSRDIALADAMELIPGIGNLRSRKQALKALDRFRELDLLAELAKRKSSQTFKTSPYLVFEEDAVTGINERIDDETIALVVCDPPWGIDIDLIGRRTTGGDQAEYDDSWKSAVSLITDLLPQIHRVMQEDGHMYYFFGITDYEFHYRLLSEGVVPNPYYPGDIIIEGKVVAKQEPYVQILEKPFFVEPVPCTWVKEGGSFTDWDHRMMPRYESFFFCSKGVKKRFNEVQSNVFEHNRTLPVDRIHPQEKSIELIKRFITISTQPNEIILDPCAGSFVTAVAATLSNRKSISFENNKNYFDMGINRLSGIITEMEKTEVELENEENEDEFELEDEEDEDE